MATFENTMSISQYATENGLTGIQLISNEKKGTIFGKDSKGTIYRVSEKVQELTLDLQVSWFVPEDGEAGYMIHPAGNPANVVSNLEFTPSLNKAF